MTDEEYNILMKFIASAMHLEKQSPLFGEAFMVAVDIVVDYEEEKYPLITAELKK